MYYDLKVLIGNLRAPLHGKLAKVAFGPCSLVPWSVGRSCLLSWSTLMNFFNPSAHGGGADSTCAIIYLLSATKVKWIFFTFPKMVQGYQIWIFSLNFDFFLPFTYEIMLKMQWVWSKFRFYVATKFCSKSYKSNFIAIETQLWHHWLAFCTKFYENFFLFFKFEILLSVEIWLSPYIVLLLTLVAKAINQNLLLKKHLAHLLLVTKLH